MVKGGVGIMNGKQRMQMALRFEQPDRPPHFELMFEVEKEAFGMQFPDRTIWSSLSGAAKTKAVDDCMKIYDRIIHTYQWDALCVYWPWGDPDGIRAARAAFGDEIMIGGFVGGGLWGVDSVTDWEQFSSDLFNNTEAIYAEAETRCKSALERIDILCEAGAEFIALVHDVAFNAGCFVSPATFAEIVTPYMARLVARVKEHGAYAIVHSDGNLMQILDQIVSTGPHAMHSIDPMAGMDIAEVKRRTHGRCALMGNVQCSLLQDGPKEAIRESALYCLRNASPGGGYIFSTSNTIFPGMPLENYEYMLEVFREFQREG
jgi:uroporphyrinogen decarboxylase